jgi:TATA-binding protein-associated factor
VSTQAMDRAHRLGQRRSVAVYRLLVRGTLEEHILGLQRFKLDVAGALVNSDNASLAGMDTSRLLDLFQVPF